jgi:hypothetical protein
MKPRIDVGGRQGRDERDGITTRNGGGSYEHGMPITFEGDEPETPTSWELILAGARWVLLAFAFVCTLMIAAGYYGA